MKKLFYRCAAVFFALIMIAFSAMPAYATEVEDGELEFSVSFGSGSVKSGNSFEVTVSCKNSTNDEITDFSFSFNYDSTKVNPVSNGYTANPGKAIISFSGSKATVSYSATGAAGYSAVAPGQTFSATFKMQAVGSITADTKTEFSVTDAVAYKRKSIASSSISADNLAHIFSFKTTPKASLDITGYSHDADLISIVPIVNNAEIAMSPSFSPDVTEYTVIVSYSIPDFKFSWTKSDANATVQYIPTEGNTLIVGDNTFKFIVTAEDKTTTKTYTAVVKRLQMGEEVPQFVDDVPEEDEEILPDESNGLDIPEEDIPEDNESPEQESTPDRDNILQGGFGTEVSLKLSTLLWIVAGVVALFVLAFMGGYVTHKNASKPAQYTIEDILTAQQYLE
ncbi:MAG: cadherin-like beta sandwich domain-containing protein, partial [Clostridia bacterium]|nr:cadherin-like beta sandwich domain-containing protein [Clostridia bacterium]